MIQTQDINVNPFLRNEHWPSYTKNIGNLYPALLILNIDEPMYVYDGIIYYKRYEYDTSKALIGDLCKWFKLVGVNSKVFKGMENVPCLAIANFSNTDITEETIISSPMTISDSMSEHIAKNIPGVYSDFVDIKIEDIENTKIAGDIIISDSSQAGKKVKITHFAHTFVLMVADCNIIRDVKKVRHLPQVKDQIIKYNQTVFGRVNENIEL